MGEFSHVAIHLRDVRERIAAAAARSRRSPDTVRLVAVSKTFPIEAVRAAFEAGQIDFGENRVQEGLQKLGASTDLAVRWHLIGHLQSNKARKAAEHFAVVQSVDSVDVLQRLDQAAVSAGKTPDLLVQVDLALEATKHGAPVELVPAILEAGKDCRAARVRGLMLLPPWAENPEEARPWFRRLRLVRDQLADQGVPPAMLAELSMGMSHDFEVAIEEGATIVRVGTAIFGERHL